MNQEKELSSSNDTLKSEMAELKSTILTLKNQIKEQSEFEELLKYEIVKMRKHVFEYTIS